MLRLGGIFLFLLGIVILSIFSFQTAPKPRLLKQDAKSWIDRRLQTQKPQWILHDTNLKIVKACAGILEEDFGYEQATPKTILFFQSQLSDPQILASKVRDLRPWDQSPIEVSSLNIRDLNFDLTQNEGIHAEHGRLLDLKLLDHQNGTRLYDRLLDEALELCTAHVLDPEQKEIEVEKIRDAIEAEAILYVSYDYSARSDEAELEVLYELDGLVLRTKIQAELSLL